jgi:GDPmannose 4,6-dehydratase
MKTALIFGCTGQDGSYMVEHLIKKNYKVYGLIRKSATGNTKNINHILEDKKINEKKFFIVKGDLNDHFSIQKLIKNLKINEIYNFADQDHVGWSFDIPNYSFSTTAGSLVNILEAIKDLKKKVKYFHPLSSNMFGKTNKKKQNENTKFNPQSIYAISKVSCYFLCNFYREAFNLKIYNSIFYNHESPRRSKEYVTKKIVEHVCEIYRGKRKYLELGDISAKIDWGYAKEYMEIAHKIMQSNKPDVYIVGTGKTHSVEEFAKKCFNCVGLNYRKYLKINKKFVRPTKTSILSGDTSKLRKTINHKIKYNIDDLVKIMMNDALKKI